jgi:hypothetical protein
VAALRQAWAETGPPAHVSAAIAVGFKPKRAAHHAPDRVQGEDLANVLRAFPGGAMAPSPLPSLEQPRKTA